MSDEVFESSMGRYKDEEDYKQYLKQRDVGFEEYKKIVLEEVSNVESTEELHFMAKGYDYDNGDFFH